MRIALDATYSVGKNLSGVGVYSREILSGLARLAPEVHFLHCYRPHRLIRSFTSTLPANCSRRVLLDHLAPFRTALYHGLNQRLPAGRLSGVVVTTFHDLFVLTGEYSTPDFRARFAAQARDAANRSDLILTVSEFTAGQVSDLLGFPRGRIRAIPHGVHPKVLPTGSKEPIVLHVGVIQKRKNVARLVKAFAAFAADHRDWRLMLAGSVGFGAEDVFEAIEASGCRERIEMPGYVSSEELERLYAKASIFAFPSMDEGFGIPVLEAMAWGIPVLTSDRSALPEAAGGAALLIPPDQTEAIKLALDQLAEDEDLRKSLITLGLARASKLSWDVAVNKTWLAYRELLP